LIAFTKNWARRRRGPVARGAKEAVLKILRKLSPDQLKALLMRIYFDANKRSSQLSGSYGRGFKKKSRSPKERPHS
jgi:hypothetical protein